MRNRIFHDWLLTAYRMALHLPTSTGVIADVHLGYGQSRARIGDAVPTQSLDTTCDDLTRAWKAHPFARLLVAGDLFEKQAEPELWTPMRQWCDDHEVAFLGLTPGNHDRGLERVSGLEVFPLGYSLGDWRILHDGTEAESGVRWVAGHLHPCVARAGGRVPCYVVGADWLILPAFSRDAAGVSVAKLSLSPGYTTVLAEPASRGRCEPMLRTLRRRQGK